MYKNISGVSVVVSAVSIVWDTVNTIAVTTDYVGRVVGLICRKFMHTSTKRQTSIHNGL